MKTALFCRETRGYRRVGTILFFEAFDDSDGLKTPHLQEPRVEFSLRCRSPAFCLAAIEHGEQRTWRIEFTKKALKFQAYVMSVSVQRRSLRLSLKIASTVSRVRRLK